MKAINNANTSDYAADTISFGPPARIIGDPTVANRPDPIWSAAESAVRAIRLAPSSWNPENFTVEVIAATDSPVSRRDKAGAFAERLDMATLDLSQADNLPVYFAHKPASNSREVAGIVQSLRVEGGQLLATLRLSQADDNLPLIQRVADGTISGISIGYLVTAWSESREGGLRVKSPKAWTVSEISFTPNPADPRSRVRHNPEDTKMPKDLDLDQPDAETLERTRRSDIRTLVRTAGLSADLADTLIDDNADLGTAKASVFDAMQTRAKPVIRVHASNDDPAVITRRQSDALTVRMAGGEPAPEIRSHMSESLLDMARGSLARAGVSTRGLSADETFTRAAHGTSDFPLVVSNAMGKVAAQAYQAAESGIKVLCRQRTLTDFKASTSIRLGDMGRLQEIAENGEITHTGRAENGESMSLRTYARGLTVSRNLLINDDLNLLGDMTAAFGQAAAQTEADILVSLLTSNPALSDGTAVFHVSRGNLSTGIDLGGPFAQNGLTDARRHMRTVKGLDGATIIDAKPKYLVVGPDSETDAEKLLASIYAATTDDVSPFAGKLTLVVEPRLTGPKWFIFADPARLASLQYGYLASAQGVQIQRAEAWDTLGLKYRAFLDFGAGWLDWRGAYQNTGV